MPSFDLALPSDLSANAPLVSWALDSFGNPMASKVSVSSPSQAYQVNGGALLINTNGWNVELRYCDQDDVRANLFQNDGVLYALDPSASTMPDSTPLQLNFEKPLSAVGAYVTVDGPKVLPDQPLHAVMWVLMAGSTTWQSISGNGTTGDILVPGASPTAAFVGVRSNGAAKIQKVRFDAMLMGNRPFKHLLLSPLLGAA